MKKLFLQRLNLRKALCAVCTFIFFGIFNPVFAQAPQAIPYQGVARNATGAILPNQNVSFRMSIRNLTAVGDRKSTRLNSSHRNTSRMPSSA